jgi:NTE family protein
MSCDKLNNNEDENMDNKLNNNGDENTDDKLNNDEDIPIYKQKGKEILILSGGGIKGIAYIGAFAALSKLNMINNFKIYVGTSVGALMAFLLIIGYKHNEMFEFIKLFDFIKLKNIDFTNAINNFGLDNGYNFEYLLKKLMEEKGYDDKTTLSELYKKTQKKLIITTVCVNDAKIIYMSHDTHPDIPVYLAIRMSISVPIYFCPVMYENKCYIDGGIIDNYPIRIFDKLDKVLGLFLSDTEFKKDNIEHIDTYLMLIYCSFMNGIAHNSMNGYERCTIKINTNVKYFFDLELNCEKKYDIWEAGYNSVLEYYKLPHN